MASSTVAGLDASFGTGGLATTSLYLRIQPPHNALALLPSGKILAAAESATSNYAWRITRLNANGLVDTAFGTNGIAETVFTSQYPVPFKIIVQADGKILVGGKFASGAADVALARYNADGSIDTTFGTNGIASYPGIVGSWISDMVQKPDGKTLLALEMGSGSPHCVVARINTDGSLDATFGSNGIKDYAAVTRSLPKPLP